MKNSISPTRNSLPDERNLHEEMNKRMEKIRNLMDEIKSFEQKNEALKVQVQHNENVLNICEEKNNENKNFLQRLQDAVELKKKVTLSIDDPFIKHNYKKLKELFGDNLNNTNQDESLKVGEFKANEQQSNLQLSDEKNFDISKIEQLRMENEYMLKVINKDTSIPVPSHYKCWIPNN